MMTADHEKLIPVGKLIEILQTLPPDSLVMVNRVQNLVVIADLIDGECTHYIDLNNESLEPML